MEEQLISLETAVLAKAKGYREHHRHRYLLFHDEQPRDGILIKPGETVLWDCGINRAWSPDRVTTTIAEVPTQSVLQRWLREQHNTCVSIYNNASGFLWNMADTVGGTDRGWSDYSGPNDSGVWDTWEEALEAGLIVALNRIKN